MTKDEIVSIETIMGAYIESIRPPENIRPQMDIGYRIEAQSVVIFEIRPQWNDPAIINEHPLAKATNVKSKNEWNVFWKRSDGKWHRYSPKSAVQTIPEFIELTEEDEHHCFWR